LLQVRHHSKLKRVDCVQIELPLSVRTGADAARDTISQVLADTLFEFYNLHYRVTDDNSVHDSSGDSDLCEDEAETTASVAGPPPPPPGPPLPPPPPPPPAIANARHGDGISHMAMMAKSKMHEELVNKAKSRQSNIEEMIVETSTTTNNTSISSTKTEMSTSIVSNKVNDIEHKLEMMATNNESSSVSTTTTNHAENGGNNHNGSLDASSKLSAAETNGDATTAAAAKQKPVQKPKLYDSIFADRKLPEKELKRRQFLFGYPAPQPKQPRPNTEKKPVEEPKQTAVSAPEPEKPAPAPVPQPEPTSKPEPPAKNDKKDKKSEKDKKKCCTIL